MANPVRSSFPRVHGCRNGNRVIASVYRQSGRVCNRKFNLHCAHSLIGCVIAVLF